MSALQNIQARAAALTIVLRGGVAIEGETEEDEKNARIVYDWLVREKKAADALVAQLEQQVVI